MGFDDELVELWRDPDMWKIAVRHTGSQDLAQDALQEAYYAVRRVRDPQRIQDVRAYFCRVLINMCRHQLGQPAALPLDTPEMERHDPRAAHAVSPPDTALSNLGCATVTRLFRDRRDQLAARIARRSADPGRYQGAIAGVALEYYLAVRAGPVTQPDLNGMLKDAFPAWFKDPGCSPDTSLQRLSRGRADVKALLRAVVARGDL